MPVLKTLSFCAAPLTACVLALIPSSAYAEPPHRMISVSAQASVKAEPDIAYLTLTARGEGKNSAEANQKAAKIANALRAGLKKAGAAAKDIQSQAYRIYPRYDYDQKQRKSILRHFVAEQTVRLTIRELKSAGAFADIAAESGVSEAGNLVFTLADPEKLQEQALKKAVEKAERKARIIVQTAGAALGEVITVTENARGRPRSVAMYAEAAPAPGARAKTELTPGETEVTAGVHISWAIR